MTIQEVKKQSTGHFFDRETMKHFGDTLKSFDTKKIDGKVYVYRKLPAATNRQAVWEFDEKTGRLYPVLSDEIYAEIYL